MDFTLTEEQVAIRNACREFAEQEIKPRAREMDRTGEFPSALIRTMGEMGLLGLRFPEKYGGAGADFLAYCLAIEEISRGDASVGITMEAHTSLGASSIYLSPSSSPPRSPNARQTRRCRFTAATGLWTTILSRATGAM